MQLFSADPTIFSKQNLNLNCVTHEDLKKRSSKIAHNWPKPFFFHSPAQATAHSPELTFHIINMSQDTSVSLSVIIAYLDTI